MARSTSLRAAYLLFVTCKECKRRTEHLVEGKTKGTRLCLECKTLTKGAE